MAYDRSHSLFYWGAKLMLLTAPDGLVIGYTLVNPKMFGEAAATSMMLTVLANLPPPGSTIVADKGLRSRGRRRTEAVTDRLRPLTTPAPRHHPASVV